VKILMLPMVTVEARRLGGASDTQPLIKLNIKSSFQSNIKLYLFLPRDETQS